MELTEDWVAEKENLRRIVGEIVVDMIWYQDIQEINTETCRHHLKVQRQGKNIVLTFKKKQN